MNPLQGKVLVRRPDPLQGKALVGWTRHRVSWPWGLTLLQGKTLVRRPDPLQGKTLVGVNPSQGKVLVPRLDPLQGKLAVGCLAAYNHRAPLACEDHRVTRL